MHPRRATGPVRIPRFSELVNSNAPSDPSLPSPYATERTSHIFRPPPDTSKRKFSPRVAAYSVAFVTVIIGGIYIGAASKDMMDRWKVCPLGGKTNEATDTVEVVYE